MTWGQTEGQCGLRGLKGHMQNGGPLSSMPEGERVRQVRR